MKFFSWRRPCAVRGDIWVLVRCFNDLERSVTLGHASTGLRSLVASLIKNRSLRMLVFRGVPDQVPWRSALSILVIHLLSTSSGTKRYQDLLVSSCLLLGLFLPFFLSCFFDGIFYIDYDAWTDKHTYFIHEHFAAYFTHTVQACTSCHFSSKRSFYIGGSFFGNPP